MNNGIQDPYTTCYLALWAALEDNPEFTAAVKAGNRIKFIEDIDPEKIVIQTADTPEVRIIPRGGVAIKQISSSSYEVRKRFSIQTSSGSHGVDRVLYPLHWVITKAIYGGLNKLEKTKLSGKNSIIRVETETDTEGIDQADLSRNIRGWALVIDVLFTINVPRETLEGNIL